MTLVISIFALLTSVLNAGLFVFVSNFCLKLADRTKQLEENYTPAPPIQPQRERALVDITTPEITYDPRFKND